jgi:hypothetical protein
MSREFLNFVLQLTNVPLFIGGFMQTETKLNIYELFCLTPEEAHKVLWKEINKFNPDLQLIEDILAYSSVDVNLQTEIGRTALTEIGRTALTEAVGNGNEKVVELLLKQPGIDVNVQTEWGRTALMFAAKQGKEKLVEMLLNHPGIDVNLRDEWGRTALMLAAYNENVKCVELLLNHPGIDRSLKNEDGETAWDWASDYIRQKFPQLNPNS